MFNNLPSPLPTVMPSGNAIPDMPKIAGPLFLGVAFNWALFGVLSVQVYIYFSAFHRDRDILRGIIFGVFFAEALQSILIARDAYVTFVIGGMRQRNPFQLYEVHMLWLSVPVLTGLVTFTCQGLFAYRIRILSEDRMPLKFAFFIICISCAVELVSSLVLAVALKQVGSFDVAEDAPSFTYMTGIWYCSSSFGDILIAVCMVYLVSQRETGICRHTQSFLHKVVRLTVGTASATAVIAIVTLLLTVVGPVYPSYYQASVAILGKMYSNSMMVMLNNRVKISAGNYDTLRWTPKSTAEEVYRMSELRFKTDTMPRG